MSSCGGASGSVSLCSNEASAAGGATDLFNSQPFLGPTAVPTPVRRRAPISHAASSASSLDLRSSPEHCRARSVGAATSCRVPGCREQPAPGYLQRYRICKAHYSAPCVDMGAEQPSRFCQQCSRLHPLSEFDGAKLSCREGLARHVARRRERNKRRRAVQPDSSAEGAEAEPAPKRSSPRLKQVQGSFWEHHVSYTGIPLAGAAAALWPPQQPQQAQQQLTQQRQLGLPPLPPSLPGSSACSDLDFRSSQQLQPLTPEASMLDRPAPRSLDPRTADADPHAPELLQSAQQLVQAMTGVLHRLQSCLNKRLQQRAAAAATSARTHTGQAAPAAPTHSGAAPTAAFPRRPAAAASDQLRSYMLLLGLPRPAAATCAPLSGSMPSRGAFTAWATFPPAAL